MNIKIDFKELANLIFASCVNYKYEVEKIQKECSDRVQYVKNTYKENAPEYNKEIEKAEQKADKDISKARVENSKEVIELANKIKEKEFSEMSMIDTKKLDKIRSISNLPLTASEIKALNDNLGIENYWCSRAIGELAEKNAVSISEVGIVPSYDVKMEILNQCLNNFNKFIMDYKPCENVKMKSAEQLEIEVGVSSNVLNRASELYLGIFAKETEEDIVSKSLMNLKTKRTDVEKGLTIGNVLNNVKNNQNAKNKILCEIALDKDVSDLAIEMSGYCDVIKTFRNGKAMEYKQAEKLIDEIKKSNNKGFIETQISINKGNEFFVGMISDASIGNNKIKEIWNKQTIEEKI